jgi:hypothetical protein
MVWMSNVPKDSCVERLIPQVDDTVERQLDHEDSNLPMS